MNLNTDETTIAAKNPIASSPTSPFITQTGASNIGSSVAATWVINYAPTKYNPAMRITLRRWISLSRFMARCSHQSNERRIASQLRIVGQQVQRLGLCLGDEHPIKRIRVQGR